MCKVVEGRPEPQIICCGYTCCFVHDIKYNGFMTKLVI